MDTFTHCTDRHRSGASYFSCVTVPKVVWVQCPSSRDTHLAFCDCFATAIGPGESALAAAAGLGRLVHFCVDLVVALWGFLGGRVRNGHGPARVG